MAINSANKFGSVNSSFDPDLKSSSSSSNIPNWNRSSSMATFSLPFTPNGGDHISLSPPSLSATPFFTAVTKISDISLERRIDFHLQRIMKENRLINFKNSINGLPVHYRICESLLEILTSTSNLIQRRQSLLRCGSTLFDEMKSYFVAGWHSHAFQLLIMSLDNLKRLSAELGQLIWALNSNKEHIKYVIKVFALPDVYARPGPDGERIALKERIANMVHECEQIIYHCQTLKHDFHQLIIEIFLSKYQR